MSERMIEANGVELCTEPFGDPADPPILLVSGIGASMLWWEEPFCRMLADGGQFVIRYDHRDTGRSVTDEPGHPTYTGADLVADAAGVLDALWNRRRARRRRFGRRRVRQVLALAFPIASCRSCSSARLPRHRASASCAPPNERVRAFVAQAEVDWSDPESVIEYVVEYCARAGRQRPPVRRSGVPRSRPA